MNRLPFILIAVVCAVQPFSDFFLKWLPISEFLYIILRQFPDILLFISFILVVLNRTISHSFTIRILGNNLDRYIIYFLVISLLGILFNVSDLLSAFANLKAFIRYWIILYIFIYLSPTIRDQKLLLKITFSVVGIQAILGIVQLFGGIPVRDFLSLRNTSQEYAGVILDFTGSRYRDVNDLMGTVGNTINYAVMLLIGIVLWLVVYARKKFVYWLGAAFLVSLLFFTGSRSAVLTSAFIIVCHQYLLRGKLKSIALLAVILVSFIVIHPTIKADDEHEFLYFLSDSYIETALNQRLGIFYYIIPSMVREGVSLHELLFGFSPDKMIFSNYVATSLTGLPPVLVDTSSVVVEDVYWFALFIYYGLAGFIIFVLLLTKVFVLCREVYGHGNTIFEKNISMICQLLILASIPLNFFNQTFEIRQYSFYLWMFVGITLCMRRGIGYAIASSDDVRCDPIIAIEPAKANIDNE